MKKIVAIVAIAVVGQVSASRFQIINKTLMPVKVNFTYTAPGLCHDDSRELAKGASTGFINTGGCILHALAVVTTEAPVLLGIMSSIGTYASDDISLVVTQTVGQQSLTITMLDPLGRQLHKIVGSSLNEASLKKASLFESVMPSQAVTASVR